MDGSKWHMEGLKYGRCINACIAWEDMQSGPKMKCNTFPWDRSECFHKKAQDIVETLTFSNQSH